MTETLPSIQSAEHAVAGKYLTFLLGRESYGVQVLKIREIIRYTDITSVPQMPAHIRGVINLRGKIIPVIDLRMKFGLPVADATERTCIVVVRVELPNGSSAQNGVIVDAVEEVIQIAAADIEPTPDFGATEDTGCLLGMAKIKGGVKTLLDIDKVIGTDAIPPGLQT
ncbi:MAG: purine-binding chemotaxis protein CheW [Verrucomicrobiae bacterium]|nr:purine-binding chemotaxis protein CheW [Verrucomicrobiae bacterium]